MALLEVDDIHAYYGNIHALQGVSLTVDDGEIVTLIGANGAGKTTLVRSVTGLLGLHRGRVMSGSVKLEGRDLVGMSSRDIVKAGVAQVPEGRGLFRGLSVLENLKMGHFVRRRDGKLKE